jgi:hypothetical protein
LAYFDHRSLWYELFHSRIASDTPAWLRKVVADDVEFESVMRRLTVYCFAEVRTSTQSWSMHTCVHDWLAANTVTDPQYYWYAFDCVAASIDEDDWDSLGHLNYARLATHAT